jgi:hypothetical protein
MNAYRSALSLLVAGYALTLGGCATNGGVAVPPASGPAGSLPASSVAQPVAGRGAASAAKKGTTATYAGTVKQTEGSMQRTGTLKIVLVRNRTKISGTFAVTFGSKTTTLDFSGTAKGKKLRFTIVNKSGCNADAHATIKGRHLNGSAEVPPCNSQPTVEITFATVRQKKT